MATSASPQANPAEPGVSRWSAFKLWPQYPITRSRLYRGFAISKDYSGGWRISVVKGNMGLTRQAIPTEAEARAAVEALAAQVPEIADMTPAQMKGLQWDTVQRIASIIEATAEAGVDHGTATRRQRQNPSQAFRQNPVAKELLEIASYTCGHAGCRPTRRNTETPRRNPESPRAQARAPLKGPERFFVVDEFGQQVSQPVEGRRAANLLLYTMRNMQPGAVLDIEEIPKAMINPARRR